MLSLAHASVTCSLAEPNTFIFPDLKPGPLSQSSAGRLPPLLGLRTSWPVSSRRAAKRQFLPAFGGSKPRNGLVRGWESLELLGRMVHSATALVGFTY